MVKNRLPMQEMQETWVEFLNQEDALEKEIATHSSVLAWRIPWTEEPGGLQSMGSQRVRLSTRAGRQGREERTQLPHLSFCSWIPSCQSCEAHLEASLPPNLPPWLLG